MSNWDELKKKIDINEGYLLALFTDEIIVDYYPFKQIETERKLENELNKLLDLRVFNKEKECRYFRGDIGRELSYRCLEGNKDTVEREQFLDIDTEKSKTLFAEKHRVVATGGGEYYLPVDNMYDAKINLVEYYGYDDYGNAYIKDYRLTEIVGGKE